MHAILGPFPQQVRSLAFDPNLELLAVGYGSLVSIHQWRSRDWTVMHEIPSPCDGRAGLVNSLFFFGKPTRKLFIGHAEAGWRYVSECTGFCPWY